MTMPGICKDKAHVICWSLLLLEIFTIQGLVSAAYYHFTTSEYTVKDIIFAGIIIGICTLLLGTTIVCLILYRRHRRRHKKLSGKGIFKDQNKLSHRMKNIESYYGSDCAICLEPKTSEKADIVGLSCQHSFHKPCIKTSLLSSDSPLCPICRQPPQPFPTSEKSPLKLHVQGRTVMPIVQSSSPKRESTQSLILGETDMV